LERPATPPPQTAVDWKAGARKRVLFYVLAALLLAALAGILTYRYLEDLRAASLPTAQALTARQDIRPGTIIEEGMVEVRAVPEAVLPAERLTSVEQAIGLAAVFPIAEGEILLPGKLSGGPEGGLSRRLPDGRWAMVLPGAWLASPIPDLMAGDRIELLAYLPGQPQEEAGLIVTAVEVIELSNPTGIVDRLTLAVSLEEAVSILYAHSNGFMLLPLLRPQGAG
jgi:Flp pilus assembly protein CpaB